MPIGYPITVVLMRLATWFALTPPRRPALLRRSAVIPGGVVNETHRLAAEGWTRISANYRLRPSASLPDHLIDAKKVIAWARTHVGDSQGEPAPIFVAGSSAGGYLAALAALTPNVRSLQPGFESADTSVSAAICLYAYFGNYYGRGADSSPLGHVGADAPPFFIAQGDLDTHSARFLALARGFAEGLSDVSASPVVYAELPGAQHAFDIFGSVRFAAAVDAIVAFARSVGAPGSARSPRSAAPGGRRARIG